MTGEYSYEGEWENDLRCGFGKERMPDGSVYEGNFRDNLRNGKGILIKKANRKSESQEEGDECYNYHYIGDF